MKYTPVLVALGVGAVAGIPEAGYASNHKYLPGIIKFGALAAGLAGELFFDWNQNVDYGLMTGAAALIGERIPATVHGGLSAVATYAAPDVARQGHLHDYTRPLDQPVAAAGCTACGEMAAAKRTAALTASQPVRMSPAGRNPLPSMQAPTGAG